MHKSLPKEDVDGLIRTLNQRGWMMTHIDAYCRQFINFASASNGWALDVGCAYGVHTLEALKLGARIIANDMDAGHLRILREQVPAYQQLNLRTRRGAFPRIQLPENSLSAVLAARVFHFMDETSIKHSVARMYQLLAAGGKAFVIADSPYLGPLKEFIPVYEGRKAGGHKWPGLIKDMSVYEPKEVAAGIVPKLMHFLDPETLSRAFIEAAFIVEVAELFSREQGFSGFLQLDGREGVALIARKPSVSP
jgi:SAM-dependent methyltransferase